MPQAPMKRKKWITPAFALVAAAGMAYVTYEVTDPLQGCRLAQKTVLTPSLEQKAPVLVILNSDVYMTVLRERLNQAGHPAYGWNMGLNTGANEQTAALLRQRLMEIYSQSGQKVALVGYSLGGVYARELAKTDADKVERVITLAALFGLDDGKGGADQRILSVYAAFQGKAMPQQHVTQESAQILQFLKTPPAVPTTSIYSTHDMFVPATASRMQASSLQAEEIMVAPGHIAMPFNAAVARVVIHRLAEPMATWKPTRQGNCAK